MYNDFVISDAERLYYTNVHKERKEQYEVISHKNHLLYREVLTAFGDHPCCLSLLYHMRKFLSIKNFNGAASGVVFSCRSALIQTAGRGFVIYQLPQQLHRGGSSPPPTSSNTEKAARGFPFSFYHIPEAQRASAFLSFRLPFPRLWRTLSGAAAYSFYNNLLKDTIIYRYYCPKNVMGCRSLFVTFSVSFSSPPNCLF